MALLSEMIDHHLAGLAWSLWTELGVAGTKRKHSNYLIDPEELILLTAVIAKKDPRLRDEGLDWCAKFHRYISVGRLRMLIKNFEENIQESFSIFAATLNAVADSKWHLFTNASPLKFIPSEKSTLTAFEFPAMLYFRLRAFFGVNARADLIAFFLANQQSSLTAADATEIGYSKRNLADVLDELTRAGIFQALSVRNQKCYRFLKEAQMISALGAIPQFMPSWRRLLHIILTLRSSIIKIEKKSEGIKFVEIRNQLTSLQNDLNKLHLSPPPPSPDFEVFWDSFSSWILTIVKSLAEGTF